MTALDVISLQSAKDYLRVDYSDDDAIITRLIYTAVDRIEQYTHYMLYKRSTTYAMHKNSIEIYDFPITIDTDHKFSQNVLSITVYGCIGDNVHASIGYGAGGNIPQPLISACYKLIAYLYENRDVYNVTLPLDVQMLVNQYRRSATI